MDKALSSPLLAAVRDLWRGYATLFFFSAFMAVLSVVPMFFGTVVSDRVGSSRNASTLISLILIAAFLLLCETILHYVRSQAMERMGTVIDERLTRICFDAFNREKKGDGGSPSQALADLNTVRGFMAGPYLTQLIDALWSPIFVVVMFLIHPMFGYLTIVLLLITAALSMATQFMVSENVRMMQKRQTEANEFGLAIARNAETVRSLGMLPRLIERWHGLHREALGWRGLASDRAGLMGMGTHFMGNGQMVLVYSVGGFLYLAGESQFGVMLIAMMVLRRVLGPMGYIVGNWNAVPTFLLAAKRLDGVLRAVEARPEQLSLPTPQGPLMVNRLIGAAPGSDKIVVADVSFVVQPGRILGVVGPSGAGKSCLARLLVGIWKARRGNVVFGDHDIAHWNQDELGRHIGYMPQDVEFLPGTVGENISRFDPEADSEKILAAAELAGIQDLVRNLPDGYATRIGAGGHVLSGGQRQRFALARAVYGNPRLVVLDEPNSSLDAASEQMLGQTVQTLRQGGATVVVVSHRISLLGYCDDLLVLNEGAVQAFGPRDQIFNRLPRLKNAAPPPALAEIDDGRSA